MTENCRNTEKQMQRGGSCPAEAVRKDFPILTERTAYLDNAATTQKPRCVIEAVKRLRYRASSGLLSRKRLYLPAIRPRA